MGIELTAAFVRTVKPDSRTRTYGDGRGGFGFTLVVQSNGFKRWYQRVRIKGRPTNIGLGGYPLVTLAEARVLALENARIAHALTAWSRPPSSTNCCTTATCRRSPARATGCARSAAPVCSTPRPGRWHSRHERPLAITKVVEGVIHPLPNAPLQHRGPAPWTKRG